MRGPIWKIRHFDWIRRVLFTTGDIHSVATNIQIIFLTPNKKPLVRAYNRNRAGTDQNRAGTDRNQPGNKAEPRSNRPEADPGTYKNGQK